MEAAQLKKQEQKNKLLGYGFTTAFHVLILVLLWWAMLHPPDPPLEYGGMELSMALGQQDMGGPSVVPVETLTPAEQIPQPVTEEQVVTQDAEEVPVTAKKVVVKKKKEVVKPVEKPRVADERALFKKKVTASSDGGRGDGDISGNEGNPNGDIKGSSDGNGTGNGLGGSGGGTAMGDGLGSYDLKGRSMAQKPDITDNSRETGKVVVGITVDRNGRVIKVQPGIKGTTNLSPILLEKARQGALQARFSAKLDGPDEQFGTMTFVFRFKQ